MKFIISLCFALISLSLQAQIKMQGIVKDSIGQPLELANVIAINQSTQALESYSITSADGKYKLGLSKASVYTIQVSYIGMKTISKVMNTEASDIDNDFTLYQENALDEIELTYEMPVTVKGDTIVYNADSFKNGTERKLEDILEKLPGVEVTDDGEIEVEGRIVSKVMVDGKDFFDGDSKIATKNIPSNAVDKVEVLKNYAEVSQLRGVTNNQDNVAINIKLKSGKKRFWFGNVTAGIGDSDNETLYLAQPKLFYYSPEYSINLIADLNNVGEIAFNRRDFNNFTGGFRAPSNSSGTNLNLGDNTLGFLNLQNNRAKDINTKFGAANFSYSPKKTLDLSGFAILTSSRVEIEQNTFKRYTNPNFNIPDETTQSQTNQKSDLGLLKLTAKYIPDSNNQLDYEILGRLTKEDQLQLFNSSVLGSTNQIEQATPYSINQNFNYYYTLDEKNIFALEAQHLIKNEDPFYNAILEDKDNYENTALALGLDPSQTNYDVVQEKMIFSNQLDAKLDYWHIISPKSDLNFTFGSILSKQEFDSDFYQYLDSGSIFDPTPVINDGYKTNDVSYLFTDIYLGTHYRLRTGKFTISPGLSTHLYKATNTQLNKKYTDDFFRVLPDLNVRLQLKKSEQLILNYRMRTQFTDVTQLARAIVLNNYNTIYSGNQELESALSHNINLAYYSFNLFNYTNVFGNISYTQNVNRIRTTSIFEPGSVVSVRSPFNSQFADESVTASGRIQRTFGKVRGTLRGNFTYSKFNQFINNVQSVNENFSQTYRAGLRTNFTNAPNIDISYRYLIQDNDLGSSRTKFYTKTPSIEFDAYILKQFTFRTDYSFNEFSEGNRVINNFDFWNASLSYRKDEDSKFEYQIKATNLLDTRSQNRTNSGNVSITAIEYFIQPRYITFRLRYEL
ncbi:MAG: carboxypeptidase regulatory-like domain-containing protein [Flavobacteriaceae bacterium]